MLREKKKDFGDDFSKKLSLSSLGFGEDKLVLQLLGYQGMSWC